MQPTRRLAGLWQAAVTVTLLLTFGASSWSQTRLDSAPVASQAAHEAAAQPAACRRDTTPHTVTFVENVLDILVQSRRNTKAAKKFFRKLLKGCQYAPRVIITDQLKSDGAAKRELLPGVEHRQSRSLNNRCEPSHRPTRQRERRMPGFQSAGHAQRFLSAYGLMAQHFRPTRHLLSASEYREEMGNRFESWAEITGTERAA